VQPLTRSDTVEGKLNEGNGTCALQPSGKMKPLESEQENDSETHTLCIFEMRYWADRTETGSATQGISLYFIMNRAGCMQEERISS